MTNGRVSYAQTMLREFIDGAQRSPRQAGTLYIALDSAFPGDQRFRDLLYALAVHARPEDGVLKDDALLLNLGRQALAALEQDPPITKM